MTNLSFKARLATAFVALLTLLTPLGSATLQPEQISVETLSEPQESWFMARDGLGSLYIFDGATGEMQGLLGVSSYTPSVEVNLAANEFYAAESFYTRRVRGDRTDVVTIYDIPSLSPKKEIKVPNKIAALPFRRYIALLDDRRFLAVFNMTPAQSVSIVDLQNDSFVAELSTPGCALTVPTPGRGFLQMCGDGKIQLIRLDDGGNEASRTRSNSFFSIDDDPFFDKPVPSADGWLLISFKGQVLEATVDGDDIDLSKPWSLVDAEQSAANWRPGGGQFYTYHQGSDLLFVLMNNEGGFSHESPGSEVWIYKLSEQRLITRLPIEHKGTDLFVSRTKEPLLTVSGIDQQLHIYDVARQKLVRSIAGIGAGGPGYLQGVTH